MNHVNPKYQIQGRVKTIYTSSDTQFPDKIPKLSSSIHFIRIATLHSHTSNLLLLVFLPSNSNNNNNNDKVAPLVVKFVLS